MKTNKKAAGHESVLLALLHRHTLTAFKLTSQPEPIQGYVKAYDPFTVSIELENGKVLVVFKHALEYFFSD